MKLDLVDVFGSSPLKGNPLGVVHGADDLGDAAMLALTRWLGFSETTFLLAPTDPGADYRVRIFYPAGELPFAGHPTLGTCHAWLAAGGAPKRVDRIVQQCGVGLVEVRRDDDLLAFRAPPLLRSGPLSVEERAEVVRLANVPEGAIVDAVHASNGPGWKLLRLRTATDVLAVEPGARAPADTDIGLIGPHAAGSELAFEIRAFFVNAAGQLVEDPVTGSLNAAAAQYLFAEGLAKDSYVAGQGQKVGADGRVHCSIDADGAVWVGGRCATIASGAALSMPV
jgi:PhzF family phenazine biosynthesis protein